MTGSAARPFGFYCSKQYISKVFKQWRWSWKKPVMKQIQKYTMKNIEYYYGYMYWLQSQDWTKLKFMDEVHFVAKGTFINLFIVNLIKIRCCKKKSYFTNWRICYSFG